MIAAEINEAEYVIGGSLTSFGPVGEWGPLACGCCIVSEEFELLGPRLMLVMRRKDAEPHGHALRDFLPLMEAERDAD